MESFHVLDDGKQKLIHFSDNKFFFFFLLCTTLFHITLPLRCQHEAVGIFLLLCFQLKNYIAWFRVDITIFLGNYKKKNVILFIFLKYKQFEKNISGRLETHAHFYLI